MKLLNELIIFLIAIGLQGAPVLAAEPTMIDQGGYHAEFKKLDIDDNAKLTYAEASKEKIFADGFSKADKNKNNILNYDEYAAYKSDVQGKESKRVISDSTITSKIKSKYLLEKGIKSFKVSVETKDGVVVLSGFVESDAIKARAGEIAVSVSGVKSVSNGIVVKP
ncbi:MAG: BON domain-containing protein [Methylophilaceae bacterium]